MAEARPLMGDAGKSKPLLTEALSLSKGVAQDRATPFDRLRAAVLLPQAAGGSAIIAVNWHSAATAPSSKALPANLQIVRLF